MLLPVIFAKLGGAMPQILLQIDDTNNNKIPVLLK
jgi:hypothetical protein